MDKIPLICVSSFGLESIVKRELQALGFKISNVSNGKVEIETTYKGIPETNLWLRCADRVLLKIGEFQALTFEELFEGTRALPWETWITKDGQFTVIGKSVKSTLGKGTRFTIKIPKIVPQSVKKKSIKIAAG